MSNKHPPPNCPADFSRRKLLSQASTGFGMVALSGLVGRGVFGNEPAMNPVGSKNSADR